MTVQESATTELVPFGRTGMRISRVGFGAWAAGGDGWRYTWGRQSDADSIATIHRAVEAGVNWIDTAPAYGVGHSEEVVGRAVAALPEADRPYVFTKCGLVWEEGDRSGPPRKLMRPDSVRREVEGSLRRLGVEAIDLLQVHWPGDGQLLDFGAGPEDPQAPATPVAEYWATMAALRQEGKVRFIGLSNHDVAQLEEAEAVAHVDVLQPPFSAIHRGAAPEIAWCAAHGTGVIVWSPMQSGLLTGGFSAERMATLAADDWRRGHPDFTDHLPANLALAEALRPVAARHGVSVAAVAVAWTLAWPGVTGAIVGARTPGQVDGWIGAGSLTLTDGDLDEIAAAITRTGAGEGPARPPRA
ncbi:aldo/keto reductase [Nonomuraea sp. NPDC050783]|uniref:aldo/keto reductase n=1 Tax=Nonomuraea sp. NPDC050783 TaxID=3154634 RepID=UPI003467D5F1